jgi:TOBE domain
VNIRCDSGEKAIAEVPRSENGFADGDGVWLWWNPSDEMRFE